MTRTAASQRHASAEFAYFLLVGATITAANILVYYVLVSVVGLTPGLSAVIAFAILVPPHFLSYAKIVFGHSGVSWSVLFRYVLTLATSCGVNLALVHFYWAVLMADPLPAQALALPVVLATNYLLLKFWVFQGQPADQEGSRFSLALVAAIIAALSAYFAMVCMVLYVHPMPIADDWRQLNDYFLRSPMEAIFNRQNGHLLIVPNALMYANQIYLDGRMSNLALVNIGFLGLFGLVAAAAADTTLRHRKAPIDIRLATAAVIIAFPFCLLQPVTQFWGLGVHNHLAILSTGLAAFAASGLSGRLDRVKTMILFVLAAAIAGTSFSAGVAAWSLGFFGAIATRASWRVVMLYLVVGLVGAALCLGVGTSGTPVDRVPGIARLAAAVLVAVGNAMSPLFHHLRDPGRWNVACAIGAVAVVVWIFGTVQHLALTRGDPYDRNFLGARFFLLLCCFALIAGFLIAVGRQDLENATLAPRFATWSTVFYLGIVGWGILEVDRLTAGMARKRILYSAGLALLATVLVIVNLNVVDRRVRAVQAYDTRLTTEMTVNRDSRPTATQLWHNRTDVWLRVLHELIERKTNVFASGWARRYGSSLPPSTADAKRDCVSRVAISETPRADEWLVTGWIFRKGVVAAPISTVYFTDDTGDVVGFARPVFAPRSFHKDKTYTANRPLWVGIAQDLRIPAIGDLPGPAGAMQGRIRLAAANAAEVRKRVAVTGESRNGSWCKPIP
ncbi:GtrA family protein [Methyloceanibacter sp. wino2]|uniref:GtrA family protein n=1 Tax=Methyloceanibacter sp. wino2 TaxID=2170729 RepID=UPI00131EE75C|nr:GtrA family protein [Methyloceanibacter sp. wino2]